MPVIPDFSPAANVGAPGVEQSMNLMQRAAQSRLLQEQLSQQIEQQRIEFEIKRPVLESQARAQLVGEANDLTAAHIINNSVANDLQRFPQYVKEWTETATIEDPKQRLNERRRILGAITPFAAIKSTAPLVKAFQEQFAQDANADKTADVIQGRLDVTGAQNEGKAQKAAMDLEAKKAQLELQQKQFEMRQQHAKELEDIKAKHAQELEATRGANRLENTKAATGGKLGAQKEMAANKINDAALKEAQDASVPVRDYETAITILNDPAIRTGTGAQFETQAKKLGGMLGFDTGNAKNIEQLNSIMGSVMLEKARGMKGSLSDKDVMVLKQISPSVVNTKEGNLAILQMLVQKAKRDVAVGELINGLRKEGETERDIQTAVFDYLNANPLTLGAAAAEQPRVQIKSIKKIE